MPARRPGRRPGRARGRDDARHPHVGGRLRKPRPSRSASAVAGEGTLGEIEVQTDPLRLLQAPPRAAPADHPRRRRARRVAEDRLQGARHLRQRPAARGREGDPGGMWAGTVVVAIALAVGLFFVVPVGLTCLIKDQLGFVVPVLARRGRPAHGDLPRLPAAPSRLRDLRRVFEYHGAEHKTISCYEAGLPLTPENAAALLAPAPALRDELPARRHDRRDLRLRPDRPARLVPARPYARCRRPAPSPGISFEIIKFAGRNRRNALGTGGHVARASSSSSSPRASPTSTRGRGDPRDGDRTRRRTSTTSASSPRR